MNLVIDANIVKGYFEETVLKIKCQLLDSPVEIFQKLGHEDHLYADQGGIIEQEWKNVVEPEWFDPWFSEQIREDKLILVGTHSNQQLRAQLKNIGFPVNTRDYVYVKTAKYVEIVKGKCCIVAEDIHFFDPKRKNCSTKERKRILCSRSAPVVQLLRKKANIEVYCVITYKDHISKN